jgi:hypothetical protein
MRILSKGMLAYLAVALSCSLLGCAVQNNNSEPVTRAAAFPRIIERVNKNKNPFYMHSGVDTFVITSVLMERAKRQFTVHLDKMDSLHRTNFNNPNSLAKKPVHIYMRDSTSYTLDEPHTIPLSRVEKIERAD